MAGEGRKNQSLLVPNVLERAEERRSTLEGVSESRTGRGETEASGSPHRLAKGKQLGREATINSSLDLGAPSAGA